jgi:hypothetical protein
MNNEKLNNIAQKVLDKVQTKNSENFGAIITILMIISIILTVIRVLQECHKTKLSNYCESNKTDFICKEIQQTAIRKSWFTKMMIKKAIRKELPRDAYKAYGYDLMNAILDTGSELNNKELITLAEATNV